MNPLTTVNFHLFKPCNLRCRFCFATFRDVRGRLPTEEAKRLLEALRGAGAEKVNFAGGEPTLHPDLGLLVEHARSLGLVVSIVTNGARLPRLLHHHGGALHIVGLSVDTADEAIQKRLGRGRGDHVGTSLELARMVRDAGLYLKLNTVVTKLSVHEDMSGYVRAFAPDRWKVFQVLAVEGMNDGSVEDLLIDRATFDAWIDRHAELSPIAEDNDAMTDSYAMIDPRGRFYGDTGGKHRVSAPILSVGIPAALAQVGFRIDKLAARGGVYDWTATNGRPLDRAS